MGVLAQGRGILSSLGTLLKQFGKEKALGNGRLVYNHICCIGYDGCRFLANWVIQMYGECGRMEDAQAVFNNIPILNTYSWNVLLTMYAQNGRFKDAKAVFEQIPEKTVVLWNAMMTAYIQKGLEKAVAKLFCRMLCEGIQPDHVTYISATNSCTSMVEGKRLHVFIIESGCFQELNVGTSLLTMYGRCRYADHAFAVFQVIVERDTTCWNAMMAAYSQNQHGTNALSLFIQMQINRVQPDVVSFVCVLDGCASMSFIAAGYIIHAFLVELSIDVGDILTTALIDMYGKSGSLPDAFSVFCSSGQKFLDSWNAITGVYAQNGFGEEAVSLFSQMQVDCVDPDDSTYVSVLTGCSHAGLVDFGWYYFFTMSTKHCVSHTVDHYSCMGDLLGRAGLLDEAEILLAESPFRVDVVTWHSLLGACKIHSDSDRWIRIACTCHASDQVIIERTGVICKLEV